MINVKFQLTLEDYREAFYAGAQTYQRSPAAAYVLAGVAFFNPVVLGALCLIRANSGSGGAVNFLSPPPTGLSGAIRLLIAIAPATLICVGIGINILKTAFRPSPPPWLRRERPEGLSLVRVMILLLLLGGLAAAGIWGFSKLTPEQQPTLYEFMIPIIPLMLLSSIAFLQAAIAPRVTVPKLWTEQPHLKLPVMLRVSNDGMFFSDTNCENNHKWSYFAGYLETSTLLLLYPSSKAVIIVPKRAFTSQAITDEFKGLLTTHIQHGSLQRHTRSGFPVKPLTPDDASEPVTTH